MRIRTLALLTSFAAFACGGDDDGETTNNTTTGPTTTVTTADTGSESSTASTTVTTDASESSSASTTVTTDATESSGSESEGSSGTPDTGSSGSESGGPSAECENYCDLFQTNCADGVGGSDPYADDDACLTACAGFSEEGLACRTGHLDGSLTGNPPLDDAYYMTHCPHGDVDGTGVCMD